LNNNNNTLIYTHPLHRPPVRTIRSNNFFIIYRFGNAFILPDALSRRDQDLPKNFDDERFQAKTFQIFEDTSAAKENRGKRLIITFIELLISEADFVRIYATWITSEDGNNDFNEQKAKRIIQQY
jgi:hypothetical protein